MKHYGDITKIDGSKIEPVDIITGGSPCKDLSIALPFWEWMAKRMVQYIPGQATMGSLFSGIGGFELVFQRAGAIPVWSSEIDEFCIAVTKERFKESDNGGFD